MHRIPKLLTRVLFATCAMVLAATTASFACTDLSTIGTIATHDRSGHLLVTLAGHGFNTGQSPISLHWNGTHGAVLATVQPDANGNFRATFAVPKVAAGYYFLVATQQDANGNPAFGTPARMSFVVGSPASQRSPFPQIHAASLATITFGLFGIALFIAGLLVLIRELRPSRPGGLAYR